MMNALNNGVRVEGDLVSLTALIKKSPALGGLQFQIDASMHT